MTATNPNRVHKIMLLDDNTPVRIQVDFSDRHWSRLTPAEHKALVLALKEMGEDIRDGYVDKDRYTRIGGNQR